MSAAIGLASQLSAAFGPLVFGAVAAATGSDAAALVSLLAFLLAGAAMFASLRMPSAELAVPAT